MTVKDKPNPCKCGAKKSTTLNQVGGQAYIMCESCKKESARFSLFGHECSQADNPVQKVVDDWNKNTTQGKE